MATLKTKKTVRSSDFTAWNFVIFLTLALMLIVGVTVALSNTSDFRSKAGYNCPLAKIPQNCEGRIVHGTDSYGCQTFVCEK